MSHSTNSFQVSLTTSLIWLFFNQTLNSSRMKKERERSPLSQEDEHTQTSSPGGGWHAKLSALNFLHLHPRRGTATSSRASSRKSSRASDASDLSELAGPWLNLPLMLVGGASSDVLKDVKPFEDDRMYVSLLFSISPKSQYQFERFMASTISF